MSAEEPRTSQINWEDFTFARTDASSPPQGIGYWLSLADQTTYTPPLTPAEDQLEQIRNFILMNVRAGVFGQEVQDKLDLNEPSTYRMLVQLMEIRFVEQARIDSARRP